MRILGLLRGNKLNCVCFFSPREAAMTIVRLVNHRNPHISILAISLLETLVQSCGYPFHLQVSTKEFLNELVRRFPERPPPFPGPVMSKILELIQSWKETICTDSRWKEDLGNIRDMHRLLMFKGYRFRDAGHRQQQQSAVASTSVSWISLYYSSAFQWACHYILESQICRGAWRRRSCSAIC